MQRILLLLPILAALSCGPDGSEPLAPEAPHITAVMGSAALASGVRGQLLVRHPAAITQYRFSVTEAGGSITKTLRPRGGAVVTTVIPILELCSWEGAAGASIRMVTRDYAPDTRTDEFWILVTRGDKGPEFSIAELIFRDPPGIGIDPCDPYNLIHSVWTPVSGAVHIGL